MVPLYYTIHTVHNYIGIMHQYTNNKLQKLSNKDCLPLKLIFTIFLFAWISKKVNKIHVCKALLSVFGTYKKKKLTLRNLGAFEDYMTVHIEKDTDLFGIYIITSHDLFITL